jgi:hypothetical protein
MSMKLTLGRVLSRVCVVALSVAFLAAVSGCAQKSCPYSDGQNSKKCASKKCSKPCKNADGSKKCGKDCKKPCCAKKTASKCGSKKGCGSKAKKSASAGAGNCPISGNPADSTITASYNGKTVAFCCKGCIGKWNALSDDDKAAKLASAK